jgi:beta-glucosidase
VPSFFQIKMNDGPQGFRDNQHPGTTTAWPSAMTVAAAWDVDLMYQWGAAMGAEFYGKGANVQLGPGVNVARVYVFHACLLLNSFTH